VLAEEAEAPDTDVQSDDYSFMPGQLVVRDPDYKIVMNPEAFLDGKGIAYPVDVQFTPSEKGLCAQYLTDYLDYDYFYVEGASCAVTYSDSTIKTYTFVDTDEKYGFVDLDGNFAYMLSYSAVPNTVFDKEHNKALIVAGFDVIIDGEYYSVEKATDEIEIQLKPNEYPWADFVDTNGRYWGVYNGKNKKIDEKSAVVYPGYGDNKPEVLLVKTPTNMKSIGTKKIIIYFDNSDGYFKSSSLIGQAVGYYNIYPQMITKNSLKVTNTKKNTIKVSWKYPSKGVITGYGIEIYDTNNNRVVAKTYSSSKTSATITSTKLKKNKKYALEIYAYKKTSSSEYRSDIRRKVITIKK
jgi:hypothetical protein